MKKQGGRGRLGVFSTCWLAATIFSMSLAGNMVEAFVAPLKTPLSHSQTTSTPNCRELVSAASATTDDDTTAMTENSMEDNIALLQRAATTKQEDSDDVYEALSQLEKQMRQKVRQDPAVAQDMLQQLNGDWRLVFTTGTAKTQEKSGRRINYFPLKAIQSFRTTTSDEMGIENGIYFGNWPAVRFSGNMEFDLKKCRLSFGFDRIALLGGLLNIPLAAGQAEELGAKSGLGSESNVANAKRDKQAFFNWISADEVIATARGGGGGLALWKRVTPEQ